MPFTIKKEKRAPGCLINVAGRRWPLRTSWGRRCWKSQCLLLVTVKFIISQGFISTTLIEAASEWINQKVKEWSMNHVHWAALLKAKWFAQTCSEEVEQERTKCLVLSEWSAISHLFFLIWAPFSLGRIVWLFLWLDLSGEYSPQIAEVLNTNNSLLSHQFNLKPSFLCF